MSIELGQIIDAKYRVVRRIGEGGMGTVYEGENQRIGRRVAIKVLHAQVAAMPEFVERFEREARAAARIGSPHVCDVLDLGDLPNGDRYIVMEYLDGVSFEDRIAERVKHTPAQLAPIAFELLEGLSTMHGARVIHRDLKPANVFLAKIPGGRGEVVKILDFGVAKLLPLGKEVGTMTQTGTMMGTPLYMSPEQARGARDVDARADVYAASVMFYRALTGEFPYLADTLNELLFKIVLEDPRPLREVAPEVDEEFAAIVEKGLSRNIDGRFQSARDYQEEIAVWGRRQGSASLSFAVTMASQPPSRLPSSPDAEASGLGRMAAAAVSAAGAGTPIAWSEGGRDRTASAIPTPGPQPAYSPGKDRTPSSPPLSGRHGGATVLGALGSPQGALVATGPGAPDSPLPATPASATAESATPASATAESATAASATAEPDRVADREQAPPPAAAPSKRGLIIGSLGAGAIAISAIVVFGRIGQPAPVGIAESVTSPAGEPPAELLGTAPALTAVTPPAPAATDATQAADTPPSAKPPGAPAESSGVASAHAAAAGTVPSPAAKPAPARPREPASRPTATATARRAAAVVTAATATAKPATTPRKFRTNID